MARILLVDDEQNWMEQLASVAAGKDRLLDFARSRLEAIKKVQSEDFDLIITDLELGEFETGGFDVLAAARARRPDVPVIVVTAYSNLNRNRTAIERGAFDYLDRKASGTDHESMLRLKIGQALDFRALQSVSNAG